MPPTIVLVHGAFAESSSWDAVIDLLLDAGHPVIAAANPLRGPATDAATVERAGARQTVEISRGSHAIAVSHPNETAQLILEAAASRVAA